MLAGLGAAVQLLSDPIDADQLAAGLKSACAAGAAGADGHRAAVRVRPAGGHSVVESVDR